MARGPQALTRAELEAWQRARTVAAIFGTAVFVVSFLFLNLGAQSMPAVRVATEVTTSTMETEGPAPTEAHQTQSTAAATTNTDSTSTSGPSDNSKIVITRTTPPTDTSIVGQALAIPGIPGVLAFLIALVLGYLAGAAAQRVILGQYGVSIGGLTISDVKVDQIKAFADIAQNYLKNSDKEAPGTTHPSATSMQLNAIRNLRRAGVQSSPAIDDPNLRPTTDPREAIAQDRRSLEDAIRQAAQVHKLQGDDLSKLLFGLVATTAITPSTAKGADKLLDAADLVRQGQPLDLETALQLQEQFSLAIFRINPD